MNTTSILYGTQKGLVRKLSLFNPSSHHVPKQYNAVTNHFVEKIGAEIIDSQASRLLDQIRETYRLKRSAFSYNVGVGTVSVETPQVDFQVRIALNSNAPKEYLLTTQINALNDSALINDASFTQIFDTHCDQLKINVSEAIQVEEAIDAMENIEALRAILDYPPDATYCQLKFESINLNIEINAHSLHFQAILPRGLHDFLRTANEALSVLNQVNLNLRLFEMRS